MNADQLDWEERYRILRSQWIDRGQQVQRLKVEADLLRGDVAALAELLASAVSELAWCEGRLDACGVSARSARAVRARIVDTLARLHPTGGAS